MAQNNLSSQALISLTSNGELQKVTYYLEQVTKSLWGQSYLYLWNQLIQKPQGSVLATASCLPFWENLNLLANRVCSLSCESRAFFIFALTSLYPKYKDKRCLFQHSFNNEAEIRGIPLTTSLNTVSLFDCPFIDPKSSLSILRELSVEWNEVFYSSVEGEIKKLVLKSINSLTSSLSSFDITLSTENASVSDGVSTIPLSFFQFTLWKVLLYCEIHEIWEQNKLLSPSVNLAWREKKISSSLNSSSERKSFCDTFSSCIYFLLCVGAPKVVIPINNLPLLDFRLIKSLISNPQVGRMNKRYQRWFKKRRVRAITSVSQKKKTVANEKERYRRIRDDIVMCDYSSMCRNCDEMTLLCRDMVFRYSKPADRQPHYSAVSKIYGRIIFTPKAKKAAYLPSLLPENDPCFMMGDEKKEKNINVLESIFSTSA